MHNMGSNQEISVLVGGRNYRLAVAEGQETRLKTIAAKVDRAVEEIREKAPSMERDQMVVLAAIQLADEMLALQQKTETEQTNIAAFHKDLAGRIESLFN